MGGGCQVQITIRGKNVPVSDSLKNYVEKKLSKLTILIHPGRQASVSTVGDSYSVEVTSLSMAVLFRGEEMSRENYYEAVDLVAEKLERQIHKYRTKLYRKLRHQGLKDLITEMGDDTKKDERIIVKTKHFPIKTMPVDEAILQMNLLGHDFFVFSNPKPIGQCSL